MDVVVGGEFGVLGGGGGDGGCEVGVVDGAGEGGQVGGEVCRGAEDAPGVVGPGE